MSCTLEDLKASLLMTFSALVIRYRACRQEEQQQHSVLPAAALLCGIPLPDVYCVLTSLPDLVEVAESCLEHNKSTS